ncbi:hypothetical protein Hanom_Chr06g00556321 [Helianthus anomalus]
MKVMGEIAAPSDNEVDLGVFGNKLGKLLEKIFEASSQRRSMALGYLCLLGPEFAKLGASGSRMTHNPSCDHLPHIPRWNLVQGSRMDSLDYCHDFYSLSFPLLRDYIKITAIVLICWMIMFNRV